MKIFENIWKGWKWRDRPRGDGGSVQQTLQDCQLWAVWGGQWTSGQALNMKSNNNLYYGHFYLNHSHSLRWTTFKRQQRMSYIDRRHQAQWQPCWHYKTPTSRDYNHSRRMRWALEVQAAGEAEMCPNLIPLCLKGIREQDRNKMHIWTLGRCSKDEEKELLLTTGLLMQVLSSRSIVLWKCHKLPLQNMMKKKNMFI